MLKIQEHIKKHGLDKTVLKFKLNVKDLGHKVMLKYSQLNSPNAYQEVHESRGIVLEKDTWNVMSMPFKRFFSHNDILSPKLDWNKTVVMEKRDGTLIQVYWDYVKEEWSINTMFSQGEEDLYFAGQPSGRSFKSLFLKLMEEYGSSFDKDFIQGMTYVFELTSQYNKVVVKYDKPELRLISARHIKTLAEMDFETLCSISIIIKIPVVEIHKFNSIKECLDSFNNKSFNFEGYVAWDGINRIKIKNPAYVAVHLAKKSQTDLLDLTKPYIFLDIVKQNEIDEFKSSFPQAKEMIDKLYIDYNKLIVNVNAAIETIEEPKNISKEEKKRFAGNIFKALNDNHLHPSLSSIFFLLHDGKINSAEEYLREYDNKKLYKLL